MTLCPCGQPSARRVDGFVRRTPPGVVSLCPTCRRRTRDREQPRTGEAWGLSSRCRAAGIDVHTVYSRLLRGWTEERALATPAGRALGRHAV